VMIDLMSLFNTTNFAAPASTIQRQLSEAALALLKP